MTIGTPLAPDPRPLLARARDTALSAVRGVTPAHLDAPTPCPDFPVRDLLGHVVTVLRRITVVARGGDVRSVPHVSRDVADGTWAAAAEQAAREQADAWADPALLARPLHLPFGTLPGAAALTVYTAELSTHTWDLAVATGQHPRWDDEAVALGLAAVRRALPPGPRGAQVPFADPVTVPGDAPLIEQLVAWQGRDPRWGPAA